MMSTLYGEPLLFKSKYVCNRSGSIQAPSSTTKVEDAPLSVVLKSPKSKPFKL